MGSIGTSYIGNIKNIPPTTVIILITRFLPDNVEVVKGINNGFVKCKIGDRVLFSNRCLAPSEETLYRYKRKDINWSEYTESFLIDFELNDGYSILELISNWSKRRDIALVCYEKSPEYCHRSIIAEILRDEYEVDCLEM